MSHPKARFARMRLRRYDGEVYLDRWGIEADRIGGIFLHRMAAPDPGIDLHDHPWSFLSIVLRGGYAELRAPIRSASAWAALEDQGERVSRKRRRGYGVVRGPFSWRVMRLDECHRIIRLARTPTWTLVIHGPHRRTWGFYLPYGWVDEGTYDRTVRAGRRDLWNEQ